MFQRCAARWLHSLLVIAIVATVAVGTVPAIAPPLADAAARAVQAIPQRLSPPDGRDDGAMNCLAASVAMVLQAVQPVGTGQEAAIARYAEVRHALREKVPNPRVGIGYEMARELMPRLSNEAFWLQFFYTDADHWQQDLDLQFQLGYPVIVNINDARDLDGQWQFPGSHAIVATALEGDRVAYNDPWDGQAHSLSIAEFAKAWGNNRLPGGRTNAPWFGVALVSMKDHQPTAPPITPTLGEADVLAIVGGVQISRDDYRKVRSYELINQASQLQQFAELTQGNQRTQYQALAQQALSELDAVWGSECVDEATLDRMIKDQVYLQSLDDLGLVMTEEDIAAHLLETFGPSDDSVPSADAQATAAAGYRSFQEAVFGPTHLSEADYVRLIVRPYVARLKVDERFGVDASMEENEFSATVQAIEQWMEEQKRETKVIRLEARPCEVLAHQQQSTERSPVNTPPVLTVDESASPSGTELWRFGGGETNMEGTPTVAGDTVYALSEHELIAIDVRTGTEKWRFPYGDEASFGIVASDGLVFFSTYNQDSGGVGRLYAVDETSGLERWRFESPAPESPWGFTTPVVSQGHLFVGSDGDHPGGVYAFDTRTGVELWRFNMEDVAFDRPPLVTSDKVVVTARIDTGDDEAGAVYALDRFTGDVLWSFVPDVSGLADPIVLDGVVYFKSGSEPWVFAIDEDTGTELWRAQPSVVSSFVSSVAIGDGIVVLTAQSIQDEWVISALDAATGDELWTEVIAHTGWLDDFTVADGVIYLCREDLNGHTFLEAYDDRSGVLIWTHSLDAPGSTTVSDDGGAGVPVVVDGFIYVVAGDTLVVVRNPSD